MKLDEKRILQMAEDVKNGIADRSSLRELLGGDRLDDIFDAMTQKSLLNSIINNGKVHDMLPEGTGIDVLEGLLNNRVVGNLSNFYMIKPSYVLGLSPEEQVNMARCISDGRHELFVTLQKLWSRGIMTEACSTKLEHDKPMLLLLVGMEDDKNQKFLQQLAEQEGITSDAWCIDLKNFEVKLHGDSLYKIFEENRTLNNTNGKNNIFEVAAREGLEFYQDLYDSHLAYGVDVTDDKAGIDVLSAFLRKYKEKMNSWELEPEELAKIKAKMSEVARASETVEPSLEKTLDED